MSLLIQNLPSQAVQRSNAALQLWHQVVSNTQCPCHSHLRPHYSDLSSTSQSKYRSLSKLQHTGSSIKVPRRYKIVSHFDGNNALTGDYAFEMATSSIRFGPGCTAEVGADLKDLNVQNVCVVTDKNLATVPNSPGETEWSFWTRPNYRTSMFWHP